MVVLFVIIKESNSSLLVFIFVEWNGFRRNHPRSVAEWSGCCGDRGCGTDDPYPGNLFLVN